METKELVFKVPVGETEIEVSKTGIVRWVKSKRIIRDWDSGGYRRITINTIKRDHKLSVHRLVGLAWLKVPYDYKKLQINHIDGNKKNNNAENLEWVTGSENVKHAFTNDLRKDSITLNVLDKTNNTNKHYNSISEVAKVLGVNNDTMVYLIKRSEYFPYNNRYIITVKRAYYKPGKDSVYTLDHETNTIKKYNNFAEASLHTGIPQYTIREILKKKNFKEYYTGGYTFSMSKDITKKVDKSTAVSDRMKIYSKKNVVFDKIIVLYDYDTKTETEYVGIDEVTKALQIERYRVENAINRTNRKQRTWLISGLGIKYKHIELPWYDYSLKAIMNSKLGLKFDAPIYKIDNIYYYGYNSIIKRLNVTLSQIKNVHSQKDLEHLIKRLSLNVTAEIIK